MPCWPPFPSLCLLAWHHPWWHDLCSTALTLPCKMTLWLKPPCMASSCLACHWIGDEHSSCASNSCRYGPNPGSSLACNCSRPNLSNWNTPDPLWNTAHKVTLGCSPMECRYFGWEGNCKSRCLGVSHLSSPYHHHRRLVARDAHHHQLPCWMLQRPVIWMLQTVFLQPTWIAPDACTTTLNCVIIIEWPGEQLVIHLPLLDGPWSFDKWVTTETWIQVDKAEAEAEMSTRVG